ncbi:MAG: sigma-70 family RNA polymerase sigma factor [Proteobacteria bacterium]|nr:sigma-70 family RNA polymerase sigma factor [Pseudomonadota bacterium]
MATRAEITQLLAEVRQGEPGAVDQLFSAIYQELRVLARRQLHRRRPGQTMDTHALVHEAYLKLVGQLASEWNDRAHFLAVAAVAMRHILVDDARRRASQKRGANAPVVTLDHSKQGGVSVDTAELIALDQALTALSAANERLGKLVELRFFGGLTIQEAATILDISERTAKREWRKARAFLYRALYGEETSS